MPTLPERLSAVKLFELLDEEEKKDLAAVIDSRELAPGDVLFRAGEPGEAMFVVVSGAVELSVYDTAGQKIVLTVAQAGDTFGELALLDAGTRTATAVATEASELLELDRDDLLMLVRKRPEAALHLMGALAAMTRQADHLLRTRVVRNPNEEVEEKATLVQRIADGAAWFSGSVQFLGLHALWFMVWMFLNLGGGHHFDPFPFGLLTMIVSLEAIFLSCLVLIAANRQAEKDRVRSDIEYEINVKAELEVAHLHEKLDHMREDVLGRLAKLEKLVDPNAKTRSTVSPS
jgi:uncharacterized membrane protein